MAKRVKRSTRRRGSMRGGWQKLNAAPVNDTSMVGPTQMSDAQGQEYQALHEGQHGGANMADPAPMSSGDQGLLPADLRTTARVSPQDSSIAAIQGMKDQGGGGRRRRSSRKSMYGGQQKMGMYGGKRGRKSRRSTRKGMGMYGGKRGRKSRRSSRKSMYGGKRGRKSRRSSKKNMYGGQMPTLNPDSAALESKSGMILPSSITANTMNPEWKLAQDPTSFVPDAVKATTGSM